MGNTQAWIGYSLAGVVALVGAALVVPLVDVNGQLHAELDAKDALVAELQHTVESKANEIRAKDDTIAGLESDVYAETLHGAYNACFLSFGVLSQSYGLDAETAARAAVSECDARFDELGPSGFVEKYDFRDVYGEGF